MPFSFSITEAGTAFSGTIKSSIGLGVLLRQGIGDTLRVSLSDDPIEDDLIPIIPANINPQKYGSIWDYIASNNLDTAPRVKIFPRYEHYFQCITDAMEPEYYRGDLLGIKQHDPILPIINGSFFLLFSIFI